MLNLKQRDIQKLIVVGDRVLIKPTSPSDKTDSGLYLPQGMHKKEELRSGFVIKVGPGYPIPAISDIDEPWKEKTEEVRYVPLQPKPGDMAVYIQKSVFQVNFNKEEYIVAPHSAILMLVRDDELRLD